jgi:hypothetical protein
MEAMKRKTLRISNADELAFLAALVAIETPAKPQQHTCYVRASLIADIREALEAGGFDWRAAHAERVRLEGERRAIR